MSRFSMNNSDQKIGYLCGMVEELKNDMNEIKDELRKDRTELLESLNRHFDSDDRRFREFGEAIEDVKKFQMKQKYMWMGICLVCSILASGTAIAMKLFT